MKIRKVNKMSYDIFVKFKRNEHWEDDSDLASQLISKGVFKEDPELPDTDYFYCILGERKIYKGYIDSGRIMRIEKNIPYQMGKELLANAKDKKIDEIEAYRSNVKAFMNGTGGIEDLLNSKSKTEDKKDEVKNG
jgi:hypothetical protein